MAKVLVVSAINFFEGGPLSILHDCLEELSSVIYAEFTIIVLIHKEDILFDRKYPSNIVLLSFPKSRSSYILRMYYEYYYFYKLSTLVKPYLWFSLHDITPRVVAERQAVYCHNPTPFFPTEVKYIIYPNLFLSSFLYKYVYRLNIHANDYIVVQQEWLKDSFVKMFKISSHKVIVSYPIPPVFEHNNKTLIEGEKSNNNCTVFFFPTFPRPFKNIEIICESAKKLLEINEDAFKIIITIDGSENHYSRYIYEKYSYIKNIQFVGLISREDVFDYYKISDCLIFPSKLETWGLPISEYKQFMKPMLVADLPYGRETVANYPLAIFFNPDDISALSNYMIKLINRTLKFNQDNDTYRNESVKSESTIKTNSWYELFEKLLN